MAAVTFTGCVAIGQTVGEIESCDWLVFSFCDLIRLSGQRRTNVHLNAVKMGQGMKPSVLRNISFSSILSKLGDEALNHTMTTILKIQFITLSNKYIQRCN